MLEILQKKRELLMKKVLAVLMTLVLAVTLCVPSFAANDDTTSPIDQITQIIQQIIGSFGGGSSEIDPGLLEDLLGDAEITPELAAIAVDLALQQTGASKEELGAAFEQMYADGTINKTSYDNLMAALEAAEEPTTLPPIISDEQAAEIAGQILSALNALGVTNDQIIEAIDPMYKNGMLPENVYNAIIEQINAAENTTAADPGEGGLGGLLGGVGDFFGGIFDTIGGLLGFGGGEGGDDSGSTTPENAGEYGGSDPTGDTAVFAVVGVAAVAGAALLLTRKKKSDK